MESEKDLEVIEIATSSHRRHFISASLVDRKSRLRLGADGFLSAFGGNELGRGSFIRQFNDHNLSVKFL
jgi:hypothetical protein